MDADSPSTGSAVARSAAIGAAGGLIASHVDPVSAGVLTGLLGATWDAWARRRAQRSEYVLSMASTAAELEVDALLERLTETEGRESLLVLVIQAAGSAHLEARLVMLAECLTRAALTDDAVELGAITALAAALGEVGPAHLAVLRSLTATNEELGLGEGQQEALNRVQLEKVFPQLGDTTTPVIAVLQRHGLIDVMYPDAATFVEEGSHRTLNAQYRITAFGRRFLTELTTAAEILE